MAKYKLLHVDTCSRVILPKRSKVKPGEYFEFKVLDTGQILLSPMMICKVLKQPDGSVVWQEI